MIKYNIRIFAYAILGLVFATYVIIFIIRQDLSSIDLNLALKDISYAIIINLIIWTIFIKWCWKWKIFYGWLVPFPDLSGKWTGHVISNWNNGELKPIPTEIVIKQSFFHMSIKLKTGESESFSNSASFDIDNERGISQLFYSYTNYPKPSVRDKSQIHYGTTLLKFDNYPVSRMTGEYWTSRESTGEIEIEKEN
ncbi:hypothetical protein JYT44_02295 [Caldithrix abyssi]|nr:hypothetical protein [Caldithrix abyssi]